MKRENTKLKLLYLREILLKYSDQDHPLTAGDLEKKLESYGCQAERKSIYNDINALIESGMDIIKSQSPPGFFVGSREFELAELKILVDAVISSKFITGKKSEKLVEKLSSLASDAEKRELCHKLHTQQNVKAVNEVVFYTIDRLFNAIRNGKKLSFTLQTVVPADTPRGYETVSRRRGKVYTVSPAGLCWDDENYYLVAYEDDAKKLKHYRVDRMTDVKVLEDKIIMPAEYCNIDMVLYQRMMFDMFGGDEETVVIEFDRELISVVVDRFGDVVIRKTPGGRYSTAVKVFVSPPFMSWVFMFGKQMKIVSPPEAVQRYCRRLREAEEGYDFSSEQC